MGLTFNPQPYQIFLVKAKWKDCTDSRPCVVVDRVSATTFIGICMSGNMDLYADLPHQMRLDARDPEYAATKLPRKECFIDRNERHEFEISDIVKQYGALDGELLKRFLKWV